MSDVKAQPCCGWAPGNYTCFCHKCGEEFVGDKRAITCKHCALGLAAARIAALEAFVRSVAYGPPNGGDVLHLLNGFQARAAGLLAQPRPRPTGEHGTADVVSLRDTVRKYIEAYDDNRLVTAVDLLPELRAIAKGGE